MGTIIVNISGGTPCYTIEVYNIEISQLWDTFSVCVTGEYYIYNVPAGKYNIICTDVNNCKQTIYDYVVPQTGTTTTTTVWPPATTTTTTTDPYATTTTTTTIESSNVCLTIEGIYLHMYSDIPLMPVGYTHPCASPVGTLGNFQHSCNCALFAVDITNKNYPYNSICVGEFRINDNFGPESGPISPYGNYLYADYYNTPTPILNPWTGDSWARYDKVIFTKDQAIALATHDITISLRNLSEDVNCHHTQITWIRVTDEWNNVVGNVCVDNTGTIDVESCFDTTTTTTTLLTTTTTTTIGVTTTTTTVVPTTTTTTTLLPTTTTTTTLIPTTTTTTTVCARPLVLEQGILIGGWYMTETGWDYFNNTTAIDACTSFGTFINTPFTLGNIIYSQTEFESMIIGNITWNEFDVTNCNVIQDGYYWYNASLGTTADAWEVYNLSCVDIVTILNGEITAIDSCCPTTTTTTTIELTTTTTTQLPTTTTTTSVPTTTTTSTTEGTPTTTTSSSTTTTTTVVDTTTTTTTELTTTSTTSSTTTLVPTTTTTTTVIPTTTTTTSTTTLITTTTTTTINSNEFTLSYNFVNTGSTCDWDGVFWIWDESDTNLVTLNGVSGSGSNVYSTNVEGNVNGYLFCPAEVSCPCVIMHVVITNITNSLVMLDQTINSPVANVNDAIWFGDKTGNFVNGKEYHIEASYINSPCSTTTTTTSSSTTTSTTIAPTTTTTSTSTTTTTSTTTLIPTTTTTTTVVIPVSYDVINDVCEEITVENFAEGGGTYQITTSLYSSEGDALAATIYEDVTTSKVYSGLSSGTYWVCVRDKANVSNKVAQTAIVIACTTTTTSTSTSTTTTTTALPTTTTTSTTVYVGCVEYGLLYNWYAATDARNIAASGWQVPLDTDFSTLWTYLGGQALTGGILKETGYIHWDSPNTAASNSVGFNARGGGRRLADGTFSILKQECDLLTTVLYSSTYPKTYVIAYNAETTTLQYDRVKTNGSSIRLIKDSTSLTNGQTGTYTGNDGKVYKTIAIGTSPVQEWLSESLMETEYRDHSNICECQDATTWANLTTGALCAYENNYSYVGCSFAGGVACTTTTSTTLEPTTTTTTSSSTTTTTTTEIPITTTTTTEEPVTTTTTTTGCPVVGDALEGGVVAYKFSIGDTGYVAGECHGIIAATSDQSTGATWGCRSTTITGADGTAIGTGQQNTIDILAECSTSGIAAELCGSYTSGIYSDWFLPSVVEMTKLYLNRVAIGGFAANVLYWTSSETNATDAAAHDFTDNATSYNESKSSSHHVRAIRYY